EVQAAQRSANASRLPFPGVAAVDGVENHALVTDAPALVTVHELNGVQRGVIEPAQIGRPRRRRERGAQQERHEDGSHEISSRSDPRRTRKATKKDNCPSALLRVLRG